MAKHGSAAPSLAKVKGKSFCFTGTLPARREEIVALIEAEGGQVVEEVAATLDYLVVGQTRSGAPSAAQKKAERLNLKGATIALLDNSAFRDLFAPTADEVLAMLRALPQGRERWRRLMEPYWLQAGKIDLSGRDLRGLKLQADKFDQLSLERLLVDGADFRGARLVGVRLDGVRGANFDGADLRSATVYRCEDCTFREADLRSASVGEMRRCCFDRAQLNSDDGWGSFSSNIQECSAVEVDLTGTRLNPADLSRSDFTRAKLRVKTASYTVAHDAIFRDADLRGAELDESKFPRCDFRGADLGEANLHKNDFTEANLAGAKLVRADLRNAKLNRADLGGADLTGANLADAALTGANIDGADFQGANLLGAKLDGLDLTRARNITPEQTTLGGTIGPHVQKLAGIARQCRRFETRATLDVDGQRVDVSLSGGQYSWGQVFGAGFCSYEGRSTFSSSVDCPNPGQGMLNLAKMWYRGKLDLHSVTAQGSKCPVKKPELAALATAAWCEVFGAEVPTEDELEQRQVEEKERLAQLHEEMLAELQGGPANVKKFNARDHEQRRKAGTFRKVDLSGKKLDGIDLASLDLQGARFDGASLKKANLGGAVLKEASFRNANLEGAWLAGTKCAGASFEGARLVKCNVRAIHSLSRVNFHGTDLGEADLSFSNLCGVDLSSARLKGAEFHQAAFDASTRWPAGFVLPDALHWKGPGLDPRQAKAVEAIQPDAALDFAGFLGRLAGQVDGARLQKAVQMLRAERFQLYSDVTAEALLGVVKSQSDPDLVYSCRLASDGSFACCTQNLNPCGGLRGALCKHLLVLLVGLTKAGRLAPATADVWVRASRLHAPVLDREQMSEALLRYKGAEAGEVDWRPTETVPEDYYAL